MHAFTRKLTASALVGILALGGAACENEGSSGEEDTEVEDEE